MGSALPDWVTHLAWIWIVVSLLSAAVIAGDVSRRGTAARAGWAWITSALYLGPLALPAYLRLGRGVGTTSSPTSPRTGPGAAAAVATLAGGGASAVAHLVGVPLVAVAGWTIAGMAMWPMILVIAVLAFVVLAVHEHAADRAAAGTGRRGATVGGALVAAGVTVAAFDVGMVGWMLLLHVNDLMPAASEGAFWFLMQVGVVVGLVTGYPAVAWLRTRRPSPVAA